MTRQGNTVFTYFDLNQFKAYNDTYGFRNGDRVIQMFSNILQQELPKEFFSGHIGGDDFFTGIMLDRYSCEDIYMYVKKVMDRFSDEVYSMYSKSDRERGFIMAKDRKDQEQRFELLSVSAVILQLNENSKYRSADIIHQCFATQKKSAKASLEHVNFSTLL